MAAKRLARTSGLDYAIMSGGDEAPLGGKAVTQLHEVGGWPEGGTTWGRLLRSDGVQRHLPRASATYTQLHVM